MLQKQWLRFYFIHTELSVTLHTVELGGNVQIEGSFEIAGFDSAKSAIECPMSKHYDSRI